MPQVRLYLLEKWEPQEGDTQMSEGRPGRGLWPSEEEAQLVIARRSQTYRSESHCLKIPDIPVIQSTMRTVTACTNVWPGTHMTEVGHTYAHLHANICTLVHTHMSTCCFHRHCNICMRTFMHMCGNMCTRGGATHVYVCTESC